MSEARGCSVLPKRAVIARRRGSHGGPRGSGRGRAQGLGGSEEGADAGKGSGAGEQEKEEEERAEPRWPPRGWDVREQGGLREGRFRKLGAVLVQARVVCSSPLMKIILTGSKGLAVLLAVR